MGEISGIARQPVVNLAEYRAARAAARTLPLLDEPDPQTGASPELKLEPASAPARPLLPREIEHRERMLRHLAYVGRTS